MWKKTQDAKNLKENFFNIKFRSTVSLLSKNQKLIGNHVINHK